MRARKSFDALTISDDFMFCKIMEDEGLCRIFLEMLLADKIGKITYLSSQNAIATNSEAKSIRLDVLVRDEIGKCYDIEMQVANEHNISKRMRFYQGAIDIALLDKGNSYKDLNDSYIVFICLFDPFGYNRAVYTFENMCKEDNRICLQDGARKIILNADAFQQAENPELRGFLQYVVTGEVNTEYTRRIDDMIRTIKVSEQMRKEYRILPAVIMDAIDEGLQQKAVQAARNLKQLGISIDIIVQATGLSKEEVENI
nr:Rpn family recombination-promoting nuclease/putative transposase [uncultured Treponema sp.]